MAQTASKKKKQKAIDEYNKQSLLIQRLVWLYYLGERTHNAEGLNPGGVVGGTTDYAIAGNIKQYLEPRNFGYSAKVSCCFIALLFYLNDTASFRSSCSLSCFCFCRKLAKLL